MSKIGKKPINIAGLKIELRDQEVIFSGAKGSGTYVLPRGLKANLSEDKSQLLLNEDGSGLSTKSAWGLHRSLLANTLRGATQLFERVMVIVGLRYKAVKNANGLVFSLGYNEDVPFVMPKGVVVQDLDKAGQRITLASSDNALLGEVCSRIRRLRAPEPYKGTGIKYLEEVIVRKDGKARSS